MSSIQFASRKQEVDTYITNKTTFYEFMLRKGFFMPEAKCSAVTVDFMDKVFRHQVWCPKQTDVHPVQLARPPSREVIKGILVGILETVDK